MDPRMFFGGMGGHPGMRPRGPPKPQPVAAPLVVTVKELYASEATKELDMDELADEEMKAMGLGGKIEVPLEKGMRDGSRKKFEGKGIKVPGIEEPGDLTAVIQVEPDEHFRPVNDDDLLTEMEITLSEALAGFSKKYAHIDGIELVLTSDHVIRPGDVQQIEGKGLLREDGTRGRLLIQFSVAFPRVLDDEQVRLIAPLLPGRTMTRTFDLDGTPVPQCEVIDYSPEDWAQKMETEDESDDEDAGGYDGGSMRCAHQ